MTGAPAGRPDGCCGCCRRRRARRNQIKLGKGPKAMDCGIGGEQTSVRVHLHLGAQSHSRWPSSAGECDSNVWRQSWPPDVAAARTRPVRRRSGELSGQMQGRRRGPLKFALGRPFGCAQEKVGSARPAHERVRRAVGAPLTTSLVSFSFASRPGRTLAQQH